MRLLQGVPHLPTLSRETIHVPQTHCLTSRILETKCSKLQLHCIWPNIIPRWLPGSMMTCGIDSLSFQQADHSIDIEHGENCLKDVIERLNSLPIQLHFVHTKDPLPESFILTYKEQPDAYANSFFPGTPPGDRKIFLHEASFLPAYRGSIFNILCHEFGHTLGMRHWNATSPGLEESSLLSVHYPLGSDNQLSVMGPYEHPGTLHFHPDDEKWLKEFYGKENGSYIQGYKIVDYPVDNVMSGKRT